MAAKNREKIKLMIVIGLAVIFVITAYFRFLAPKASSDVTEPAAALAEPQTTIPKIEIKKRQNDPEPASSSVSGRRFVQRDIFAPLNIPVAQKIKKNRTRKSRPTSRRLNRHPSRPSASAAPSSAGSKGIA
jgi:hypothetical protein